MAYIESEVIVKHASNPAGMGIILRGIDATRAPRVLDLERTLTEGKVDYLLTPDKIPPEELELTRRLAVGAGGRAHGDDDARRRCRASHAAASATAPGDAAASAREARAGEPGAAPPPSPPGHPARRGALRAHAARLRRQRRRRRLSDVRRRPDRPDAHACKSFRVAGHFYTGMYEFDSKLAYVSLPEAQKFLGMQGEVTGIEVRTVDPDRARDVAAAIARAHRPRLRGALLGGAEPRACSWRCKLEKIAMFVVLTFIALVASFSIVSNLIMLVTEKGREVAILKSMGARDGAILRVFFAEGLYIGLVGLALGLTFGIGGCLLLSRFGLPLNPDVYYIQKLPVVMRVSEIASVALAALGLCCLATLLPGVPGLAPAPRRRAALRVSADAPPRAACAMAQATSAKCAKSQALS